MEVLSADNKIMTVNGKLAKAPSITGTGDMKKSVYDPTGIVEAAGGIPDYVEASAPVTSVNSKTGAVVLTKSDVGLSNVDNVSINACLNRTTAVNAADTNYTALMARGEKLMAQADFDAVTDWSTELVNGAIAWGYE